MATVILPIGWQKRLQKLTNEDGETIANVAEIYVIAVSKLIAGREKDYVFLSELISRDYITIDKFLERAKLVKEMPQSEILIPRLENLANALPKDESLKVKSLIAQLK